MNQWPIVKLGDVCERKIPKWDRNGKKKYIDISTVSPETKKVESPQDVLGEDAPSRAQQIIQTDDVLVSTVRPNLNAVAKIPSTFNGHIASTGFCVLRATEKIDPGFLFHFVQTQAFIQQCINKSTGISYPSTTANKIREIQIPLPTLEKQAEIAEVLRNSAQQITLQQNSIKQTSSICSNYYNLIQKDNYPELSLMNAGITKTSGKSITAKGNDPHETNRVLKVNAVSSGSFKPEESKPLPKSYSPHPSHSVCYGDLLFARASGTAALLGACTIVDKTVDNIFLPDKIWNLQTNGSPISKFYLLEALRSNNFRKIAESQFSSSTGVKNIKTSVLMNFAVKVPPPDTLNKFNQVFKYTASIIQKQKEKLALLEELYQSLATRAFAGQL
ncbi:restriction endonuclease subunit S [Corynebacterium amycolatum]|uniref:restriction endonuclease subunit S n=1 Tax=Corynebacterium amycolatum TaxID=43765 RepID=UPI003B5C1464